jgi:hypothetical protein
LALAVTPTTAIAKIEFTMKLLREPIEGAGG